ncbi:MAG: endonuclease/exonuclease/phosphatase family protein [Bacteroides sp.]|nr:endonuclease/exonuclease/phosphatase family protein [Bacteroides sp.]MCM1413065.1 endonuclease/exonuclease/phosphatase family protein [Bacteroides sp.]MCM1471771.1 endonuclease/exonuclease/phosphatase family protein [Bacteroides sp.]
MTVLWIVMMVILAVACNGTKEAKAPEDLTVMSFNVRYDNPGDSMNNWRYRADRVADAIMFYHADIVGTQEVLHNQLMDLKERLKGYAMVGVGREDGKEQGEYAALWYDTVRFELVDSGNFWLSETPDVAGSMGWDGACVRIATWAKLLDRDSQRELLAVNTHLDHVGQVARREGVNLLLNRISEMRGDMPVVVTGDFNSTPDSEVVAHISGEATPNHLTNTRTQSPLVYGPAWSYHEWGKLALEDRTLIDYIFIGGPLTTKRYGILAETNNGLWLSDHCPVLATMSWQ